MALLTAYQMSGEGEGVIKRGLALRGQYCIQRKITDPLFQNEHQKGRTKKKFICTFSMLFFDVGSLADSISFCDLSHN